jgi:hypothetical protein
MNIATSCEVRGCIHRRGMGYITAKSPGFFRKKIQLRKRTILWTVDQLLVNVLKISKYTTAVAK